MTTASTPSASGHESAAFSKEPLQIAVVGPGRLGKACALNILDDPTLVLAGVVERAGYPGFLRGRLEQVVRVTHIRDLPEVDLALVCVPCMDVLGVAHDLLQARIPVVECARHEGAALQAHHQALDDMAHRYRCKAMVGAGWDPGVLPIIERFFRILIPHGSQALHRHPGVQMHHSPAVSHLPGVREALEAEFAVRNSPLMRYVYVSLQPGAVWDTVRQQIESDPLYMGEATQVFLLDNLDTLKAHEGQGLVLERLSGNHSGDTHSSLLLEARFDPVQFAARAMVAAAHQLPSLHNGAHWFGTSPSGA